MEKEIFQNGIAVYYYPLESTHSTSIGLYIKTGSSSELKGRNGITHLLEHLHFRHLYNMTQKELYLTMDKMGASLRATTYKEIMQFNLKVRPMFFNKAIEIFQKIVTTYDWSEEELEAEKNVVYNEIASKEAYVYTEPIMDSIVWKDHPLSMPVIGKKEDISKLKLDDIIKYKQQSFSSGNIALVITGRIFEGMKQIVKNVFENISISNSMTSINSQHSKYIRSSLDVKIVQNKWDYVDIMMSFKAECNSNRYELMVLNSILGGGTTSKLQWCLREEFALTSDIYSYVESFSDDRSIRVSLTTHKRNICDCIIKIVSVINNLKNGITDEDMEANLPYFTENLWYWLDDSELLNAEIGWDVFNACDPLTVEERIAKYKQINKNRLMNLARKMFVSSNTALLIVGSAEGVSKKTVSNILLQLDG